MRRERPTSVLVIAILHLIGGSLGLLFTVCGGGLQLAGGQKLFRGMGGMPVSPEQRLQDSYLEFVEKNVPAYEAIQYGQLGLSLIMGLMMISAGIGLIKMQDWARRLSIGYAILSLLGKVFGILFSFLFIIPVTQDFVAAAGRDPQFAKIPPFVLQSMSIGAYAGTIGPALFAIYPIVVLIIMLKRSTVEAFQGRSAEPPDEGWGPSGPERSGERPDSEEPEEGYRPGDRWGERH